MGDDSDALVPLVQQKRRRFEHESGGAVGAEVERDGVPNRWRDLADRSSETGLNRAVMVAGEDLLDLRMGPDAPEMTLPK